MDHPPRAETEAAIASVQGSIARLEHESSALEAKLELRKKQFALVMHAVDELQRELEGEPDDALLQAEPEADSMDTA
jgi:THO complex subunit 7